MPFNVEVGTPDATRTALQASFVGDGDRIMFESVHVGRAEVEAGLVFARFPAQCLLPDTNVGFPIYAETIEKKLVFDLCRHLTLLQPSHMIRAIFDRGISSRILFQIIPCFSFLGTPSTVSISRAAKLFNPGKVVKSSW